MDTDKIIRKLEEKGIYGTCDKCGGQKSLNEDLVQLLVGANNEQAQTFSSYVMFCNDCGHLDFYSAQHLN